MQIIKAIRKTNLMRVVLTLIWKPFTMQYIIVVTNLRILATSIPKLE